MDPALLSVSEMSRQLQSGNLQPSTLVDACLSRIEALDAELHCMTQVFAADARQRARALEAEGPRGPLWGIPWVTKEILATRTGFTTCGSRLLEGFRSPYDATVVERLEAAGAVLLGKSNMDEFAMGSSTENSAFGASRNPWKREHVPGGSSGGSAAAIAADYAGFALGTDTGGSIRQPAGFCGVVGLKPTYGRVSRYGLVAFASSLDQIGPITKTTEDAARVLQVLAGHDPRDSTSLPAPVPDWGQDLIATRAPSTTLRVGVPHGFVQSGVDATVREDFESVLTTLQTAGAKVVDVEIPHAEYAIAMYYVVATAEASSNLARYDGVRYTHREGADDLASLFERTRTAGFGREVKRRILLGTFVLSSGYYDAYYLRAQKARTLLRRDFAAAFAHCDVIAIPTSPTPPFQLGERTSDPLQMYLSDVFTVPANLVGLPAVSIPTRVTDGLPLGVQLCAPALEEGVLLRAAAWLEGLLGFERLGTRAFSS
jgi:aspartyl-tRNA(Asn)/glutamyl-tRNA(Gln) amidotransferase subunit A